MILDDILWLGIVIANCSKALSRADGDGSKNNSKVEKSIRDIKNGSSTGTYRSAVETKAVYTVA